jgi:TRAP-type C4-dicarboxylate transport system substrate-binding protein
VKRKTIFILLALTLLVLPLASACSGGAGNITAENPVELSYANFFPPTHGNSLAAESWMAEIETRSEGRVKFTYHPAGALAGGPVIYESVVSGIADIGMTVLAYTRGRFPLMEGIDLPVGYPDGMAATVIANEIYDEYLPEELADTHALYLHAHGPGLLHTQEPVRSLEDLKGMKIRCTGLAAKIVEALGGTPVAMGQGDTYDALQKGTVVGTFGPIEVLDGWNQAEVIDYTTDTSMIGYTTTMWVGMNQAKWDALPKDIQKIFTEVSQEWIPVHGQVWDDADAKGLERTLAEGNEVIKLDAAEAARWVEAVKGLPDAYSAAMDEQGLPGDKLIADLKDAIANR